MASSPQLASERDLSIASKHDEARKMKRRIVAGVIVIGVVASAAYAHILLSRGDPVAGDDSANRTVYPDPSTMALSGTRVGRDIQITWNPESPTFSDARIGVLTIKDGESQREIALTTAELQARKVIYTPATDRVEAALEVFSPNRKSARESVLFVLEPRGGTPLVPIQNASISKPGSAEVVQSRSRTEQLITPPVRGYVPPPTPRRAAPDRVVVIDPPPPLDIAHSALASAPAVQLPQVPPARPNEIQAPSTAQQGQPPSPSSPRRPIRQVRPELPPNVSAMLSAPVQVEVRARIDSTGKVVHAESLGSAGVLNRYLGTAAVSAAKLWRFEPGNKAEDTIILKFIFAPR
jgi:hypothetical protein